jgi:cell fate regulator YaaT (PSP1 superfamily)
MTEGLCPRPPCQRCLVRMRLDVDRPGRVCGVGPEVEVRRGCWYVVTTGEGERLAVVAEGEPAPLRPCAESVVGTVTRAATVDDLAREERLAVLRAEILALCRRRARELDLPLRPVAVTTPLNRETICLTFAAAERVDVRELARELSRRAQRRVSLRPLGVRDQAKVSGGLGHCGRMLCCTSFMTRFASVTVKMAKAQNLALNPSRISGMCGRLMCCLAHEAPPPPRKTPRQAPT